MRITVLAILLISAAAQLFGQNRKFLIHYNLQHAPLYDEAAPSGGRLELDALNSSDMSGMVMYRINQALERKLRKPLEQDSLLNKISFSAVQTFSRSRFNSRKSFNKELKNLNYLLKIGRSKQKMFIAFALKINLLDLSDRDKFYHDKRPETSSLDLYKGNRPTTYSPESENFEEPEPLEAMTEIQMVDEVIEAFENRGIMRSIFSRKFTNIGMSVKIEKRSMYKNKRPFMYLFVILTGKQNEFVRKKDKLDRLTKQDELYE